MILPHVLICTKFIIKSCKLKVSANFIFQINVPIYHYLTLEIQSPTAGFCLGPIDNFVRWTDRRTTGLRE